jgi:hypothetical protein
MNRLVEFTVAVQPPPNGPATADQKRTQREHDSRVPLMASMMIPNFVAERGRPQPVPCDLPVIAPTLEAKLFGGQIQFPSSTACTLDSAAAPAREITPTCRIQSKRSRRLPPHNPAAFSLRTHRRRVR